ncbi:MAG TPA: hypothetical protein VNM22_06810 [Candidatus Limnocylindrales bacterium]|nr:hypothetical protein [Candidatus Limnocylindrales bacterium]
MKLYTPGFGEIPDMYITYGLFEGAVRGLPYSEVKLFPQGQKFILEIEADESDISKGLIRGVKDAIIEMLELFQSTWKIGYTSFGGAIDRLDLGRNYKSVPGKLKTFLKKSWDLSSSYKEAHHKCSKKTTPYLPITPQLGTKRSFLYETVERKNYYQILGENCCFPLCWVGLHYYSSFYTTGDSTTFCTLIPTSLLDKTDLLPVKDISTRVQYHKESRKVQLNLFSLALYLLSKGETLFALNKPWKLCIYNISISGKAPSIRSYTIIQPKRFLEFISVVKSSSPNWLRLLDSLIKEDKQESISLIAESLLFNNTNSLYDALKQVERSLGKEEKQFLDEAIVDALYKTIWSL